MARTWYLDTETKGTGAHVAPLAPRGAERAAERELELVRFHAPAAREHGPSQAGPGDQAPLTFKLVDVMSARVLATDVDASTLVELLEGMRSIVDARIYARPQGASSWRLLGLDEQRVLWGFRGRARRSAAA